MKVICISGQAGHGKDTVAQMMRKSLWGFGKKVLIIHYADLLKYLCKQLFNWDGEKDEHGRTLLQQVGTQWVRARDADFWVRFVSDVLTLFNGMWDYVLIPDCRFLNEVSYLVEHGFDVVHIAVDRGDYDAGLTDDQKAHASETEMRGCVVDHIIQNRGNLSDLTGEVIKFIFPLYAAEEAKKDGQNHTADIA